MRKLIGRLLFFLAGWKLKVTDEVKAVRKCVLIAAPHTSNWDFYYAIGAFWMIGVPMKFLIKDNWTRPWYGFVIRKLGGIGVNRQQRNNLTQHAAQLLKDSERLFLLNCPEGTRSFVPRWRTGFYYIAIQADVPIVLGYVDYKKKEGGIVKVIQHQGKTREEVMLEIQEFYKDKTGRHPENYNPQIF